MNLTKAQIEDMRTSLRLCSPFNGEAIDSLCALAVQALRPEGREQERNAIIEECARYMEGVHWETEYGDKLRALKNAAPLFLIAGQREVTTSTAVEPAVAAPVSETGEQEGYPGIAHDFERMRTALTNLLDQYEGVYDQNGNGKPYQSKEAAAAEAAARDALAAPRSASAPQEGWQDCAYCGVSYPKPVSYHHSTEECHANEAAARSSSAAPRRAIQRLQWVKERLEADAPWSERRVLWDEVAAVIEELQATPSATAAPTYWQVGWAQIEQRASGALVIGSVSDEKTEHHNQPVYVEVKVGGITVRPMDRSGA